MDNLQNIPTGASLSPIDKEGNVNLANIQENDLAQYKTISGQLSEKDANSILNFGAEIQNSIAKQSDTFLTNVRAQQGGEIGGLINELLSELNYIDVDELNKSGFQKFLSGIPLLNKLVVDVKKLFQKYDKITANVDRISNKVKAGMINSVKDNTSLQTMFDGNVNLIKELEKYIVAGQLKFKELNEELAVMEGNPANYQDYEIADKRTFINRLDKRLADMKVVRFILLQSLAQIRVVQNNNTSIAEKAQSILTTTMPVWKNQLTLAVALQRQKQNIEVQRKVSETTNTILQKNAEMLKMNSIEVAKENENTIVSLDTLKMTTKSLIDTLTEVKQIHEQGTKTRRELDAGLQSLEEELKKGVVS
ncbi:tellurite resistance protein [Flavobacterium rivuli WB 3.3-2 = DSM 21788]|uniref:Tellurite resistance protein n=1 Tax=Flavobacterium rivuli WB 3.3-2 = DSM 21788 TaxID=1121895 RepID=A0A0A2M1Y2_9FLAO|nr:toxic anion resistance protein [Flavobacterium rivuli]KGO86264.1 tellurite resistance protein [Flavobacterium rivuli WB 3.3-2 = DSM 21788]